MHGYECVKDVPSGHGDTLDFEGPVGKDTRYRVLPQLGPSFAYNNEELYHRSIESHPSRYQDSLMKQTAAKNFGLSPSDDTERLIRIDGAVEASML